MATLEDLADRKQAARAMGGPERLARHHAQGKLDARARIDALLDKGSFSEIGTLVGGAPADAVVTGWGTIDGRPVMVAAEDFTTLAGSIGPGTNSKRYRVAELALQEAIPLVMLLEGAGYRPAERGHGGRSPTDLLMQARCSGEIPVVTGVMGPSAGHGALVAPMSDFTVMTEAGAIFTAGPPVVRESTGEEVSKEELGGPTVAQPSGLIHNVAADDKEAVLQIRRYLSYFPSSAWSYPPTVEGPDQGPRHLDDIVDLIPRDGRKGYDMAQVLDRLVDEGDWFEIQPGFGRSIILALARLGGHPVAIIANQPKVLAGAVDADAADKAAHFITVADSFHVPLVFLADNPGMLPGRRSESQGVLRSGARMFAAQTQATCPKINITLRKAYGFGSMVMAMIGFERQTGTFALPGATLGAMGAGAMSRATKARDDTARALRLAEEEASYRSAAGMGFDELIDPRESRNVALATLRQSLARRQRPAAPVLRKAITP
jgi:acetyl-CoA carboxylase carboxyltransferase component